MGHREKNILGILYGTELFGRERENIECYKALQALGWRVRVFGSYREPGGGAVGRELSRHGLLGDVLPFGSHFALSYFRTIKGYGKRQILRIRDCSRMVLHHIRIHQPDAIVLGSHMEFLYLWPALLRNQTPLIYRVGDGPIWDSRFHRFAMKQLLKRATLIAPVSRFISDECAQLLPGCTRKSFVIWNIPPTFTSSPLSRNVEANPANGLRIVYVGQMTEKKGVRVLIESLGQIQGNIPFECRIAGGSQFSSEFEKEMHNLVESLGLSSQVTFTGRIPDPTPHYQWANLHVAPSLFEEPFGLVIAEAKRASIPSIVFPRGGMPELVNHQENGWICDTADVESLTMAFKQCAQAPLEEWGKNARQHHELAFTQRRFQNDWKQLLDKLDS